MSLTRDDLVNRLAIDHFCFECHTTILNNRQMDRIPNALQRVIDAGVAGSETQAAFLGLAEQLVCGHCQADNSDVIEQNAAVLHWTSAPLLGPSDEDPITASEPTVSEHGTLAEGPAESPLSPLNHQTEHEGTPRTLGDIRTPRQARTISPFRAQEASSAPPNSPPSILASLRGPTTQLAAAIARWPPQGDYSATGTEASVEAFEPLSSPRESEARPNCATPGSSRSRPQRAPSGRTDHQGYRIGSSTSDNSRINRSRYSISRDPRLRRSRTGYHLASLTDYDPTDFIDLSGEHDE